MIKNANIFSAQNTPPRSGLTCLQTRNCTSISYFISTIQLSNCWIYLYIYVHHYIFMCTIQRPWLPTHASVYSGKDLASPHTSSHQSQMILKPIMRSTALLKRYRAIVDIQHIGWLFQLRTTGKAALDRVIPHSFRQRKSRTTSLLIRWYQIWNIVYETNLLGHL